MYLSRQLYEEALHVQFYLTLLDTYIPDHEERERAFAAIHNIPSIKAKADFCFKYMDGMNELTTLNTDEDRRKFLLNLACFSTCIEGLFFFAAFAYVYFLRSKGLLTGLASGTNWVFRDESMHMNFALQVFRQVKDEYPDLVTEELAVQLRQMIRDAVDCEMQFADDVLSPGIPGLSTKDMRSYLEFVGDRRLEMLGLSPEWGSKNPFDFMELQGVQELTNFFERRVSAYQVGVSGEFSLEEEF
jgi:ribonucleoside-diphosphate reductase beta chain